MYFFNQQTILKDIDIYGNSVQIWCFQPYVLQCHFVARYRAALCTTAPQSRRDAWRPRSLREQKKANKVTVAYSHL